MRPFRFAAACLAAALAGPAAAQDDAPDPPRIDPAALDAARAMGERLRALDAFTIEATLSTEEVLESGASPAGSCSGSCSAPSSSSCRPRSARRWSS